MAALSGRRLLIIYDWHLLSRLVHPKVLQDLTRRDGAESADNYEAGVARPTAAIGDAPHANMTPVAWQPGQQRSDPPPIISIYLLVFF